MSNVSLSNRPVDHKTAHLLVVDDDDTQLQFYANGLSKHYTCQFAKTADEAFSKAQQHPQPALILLDIMMPDCDGFELCARFKNNDSTKGIPIIFVSSLITLEHKTKGFDVGCVDYITKPVLIPEMEARVETHIKLRQQADMLEALAYTDPLTQVANRRRYNETMLREWTRCARYEHPMSLLIMDIDNFKSFNDLYGHSVGDDCLVAVAKVLKNIGCRPGDLFARIGGEEFILLLGDCDQVGATLKAKEIQSRIKSLNIDNKTASQGGKVTLSIGVAVTWPSPDSDPLALFQAADEALYCAKEGGRNKWMMSTTMAGDNVTKLVPRP